MDANGYIYEALREEDIPVEDRARLQGYLKARAEADAKKREVDRAFFDALNLPPTGGEPSE